MTSLLILISFVLRALSIFSLGAAEEVCDQGVCHYEPIDLIDIPEIPGYTGPTSEMIRALLIHNDTVHAKQTSSDTSGLYRYELANGTAMYSLYSLPELVDQGVVTQKLDTKRNVEYIVYGIGIYTTTYGVLRVTARATNNGVLHRVADLLGGSGIEAAALLRAIYSGFSRGTTSGSGTHWNGRESLWSSHDIETGDGGQNAGRRAKRNQYGGPGLKFVWCTGGNTWDGTTGGYMARWQYDIAQAGIHDVNNDPGVVSAVWSWDDGKTSYWLMTAKLIPELYSFSDNWEDCSL